MIIGLTGTIASGKGTVANYLKKKGFDYYSLSDEIRELMNAKGIPQTRDSMTIFGNELRKQEGEAILARRVIKKITKNSVVDSIRNPVEAQELRKHKDFILVSIDAPQSLRFERSSKRARPGDGQTIEDFMAKEEREMHGSSFGQQLKKCMDMADYTIINDGSLAKLYNQIENIISKIR